MNNRHIIKVLCTFVVLVSIAASMQAQANRTGYFLKGNPYNYRLNPSFQPDRGYFSFPMFGNTSLGVATNLGISDFIYPMGDGLTTFMHPDVSADEFLSNLNKNNNLNMNMDMTILSFGFYAFGGYNTFDIGAHLNAGFNIPKDIFHFMKDMGAESYSLANLGLRTRNYVDVAIGHSHEVAKGLTIGARLKFLIGLAYAEAWMERMELSMNETQWQINAKGNAVASIIGSEFSFDENGMVNGIGEFKPQLSNWGLGADLGATYDFGNIAKGLIISASVNDINYIRWKNAITTGVSPEEPYSFNGFEGLSVNGDEGAGSVDEQLETIASDLSEFFALDDVKTCDYNDFWGATVNVGVEYKMPFYDRLSVGALFTHRFDRISSYTMGTFVLNLSPLNFFDLSASASVSTYGYDWGAMLNIHCPGFNIFASANLYAGKVGKVALSELGVPMEKSIKVPLDNMNASFMFGLNFPFGKRR